MARKIKNNNSTVSVRLSKTQIDVLKPAIEQLVWSYQKYLKSGTSPFTYPFRILPPPRGFDRGVRNQNMEEFLDRAGALKTNGNIRPWMEMDTFQLRAAAFAIRTYIEFVRSYIRQQLTFYRLKLKQRIQGDYVAQLRAKSEPVI